MVLSIFEMYLKGLSVIVHSKLYLFPNPQIFLHIQRELHCNNLPIPQLSQKQHIFEKRENSLFLELNIASDNEFKQVFLEENCLNLDFLRF